MNDHQIIARLTLELARAGGAFSGIAKGLSADPNMKDLADQACKQSEACIEAIRVVFPKFSNDGA